jgi:hypothetical protein
MPVLARPRPVRQWIHAVRRVLRALARLPLILLTALAAGLGAQPPPRPFRQQDDVVQVDERERR